MVVTSSLQPLGTSGRPFSKREYVWALLHNEVMKVDNAVSITLILLLH